MSLSRTHNFSSLFCFVSSCRGWRSRDCVVGGGSEHRRNNGGEEVEIKLEALVAAASPGFHSSIDAFSPSCHRSLALQFLICKLKLVTLCVPLQGGMFILLVYLITLFCICEEVSIGQLHWLGQQSWLLQPKTKKWRLEQEKMMLR